MSTTITHNYRKLYLETFDYLYEIRILIKIIAKRKDGIYVRIKVDITICWRHPGPDILLAQVWNSAMFLLFIRI